MVLFYLLGNILHKYNIIEIYFIFELKKPVIYFKDKIFIVY